MSTNVFSASSCTAITLDLGTNGIEVFGLDLLSCHVEKLNWLQHNVVFEIDF